MARRSSGSIARTALERLALGVRVLLFVTLGAMLLLGISEFPMVRAWLGDLRPDREVIGIVAGHWQSDSGAVCPDGLREVDLNLDISRRVAGLLRQQGYDVEVLPEFSAKLDGYLGAAFLAIHVDSCAEHLSGFKVVGAPLSSVPARQEALVTRLTEAYSLATGLSVHSDTITEDMVGYHAWKRIDPSTPAAIIECGFMGGDRYLLTEEPERVAVGIANGLASFLRDEPPGATSTTIP